jgi:Zn-dependent peptidase ImmA (M78 family)
MEELRWTIAHELGHLTMHGFPTSGDLEAEADAFAGEFLTPRHLIFPDLKKLTFGRLPALKMHWGISMKALIKRAEVIGAIDKTAATRLYKQYSARRWNNAEPYPLPPESPSLIREAARVHFQDHGYSVAELADAVRLTEDELRRELLEAHGSAPPLSIVKG